VIQVLSPEALSMTGAAQFLGVSQTTLKQLIRTRKLAYVQLGSQRGWVFLVEDLRNFLKENRQATGEAVASIWCFGAVRGGPK
jgi:excisionase family DNA binding protein